ncbi:hypothetical protein [Lacticaseibacillus rhamnosus]|uniref:hypothetical protein n=1 Tax=Lacticaseibacillus rhamnosus TaxID=47715 RepID=UPI00237FBEA3|nr:hypothetical protein [Lacticaseibacillus rhamnosus]MDE3295912.1 hypothetical protein [Lacticaseibacillus rhamnosus]
MTNLPGYTINDMLGTDYRVLFDVLSASGKQQKAGESRENPIDLLDAVRDHKLV